MKAAVYTRVSSHEQAMHGYSIDEQERQCRAMIEAKGWEYFRTYSDPGISGRILARDGLLALLEAIDKGKIDAVVVFKLDRLSRKQRDMLALIEDYFIAKDVKLISLTETLDTSTAWGRAMIGILSSFAELELDNINKRTRMGIMARAAQGKYTGGTPPYGYYLKYGKLEIEPTEATVVRLIYHLREIGYSMSDIVDEIEERGYVTRAGKAFHKSTIDSILRNRKTYEGYYRFGGSEWTAGEHDPILESPLCRG